MSPCSQDFPGHATVRNRYEYNSSYRCRYRCRVAGIGTSTDIDSDIVMHKYVQIKMTNRISFEYILLGCGIVIDFFFFLVT